MLLDIAQYERGGRVTLTDFKGKPHVRKSFQGEFGLRRYILVTDALYLAEPISIDLAKPARRQ